MLLFSSQCFGYCRKSSAITRTPRTRKHSAMTTLESPTRGHHPIARFLHVTIGLISLLLAVPFALIIFVSVVSALIRRDAYLLDPKAMTLSSVFTAFFGLAGFRLISGRGAKAGGGLFSPMGYRLVGFVLAVLALIAFFGMIGETILGAMIAVVLLGMPAVLCFVAAQQRAKETSR